jgi:hypothetical protein
MHRAARFAFWAVLVTVAAAVVLYTFPPATEEVLVVYECVVHGSCPVRTPQVHWPSFFP